MYFTDALTLDAPKRTSDGYMAVRARAARTGIYDYLASEVGAPADRFKPTDKVKIYRDEAEVFAADSVRSFIGRPITNDHPTTPVTASNWRDHARGTVMGAVRDGEYLAFDLVLMDQAAIAAVDAGKRELSNGYACQLDWTPGTTKDGQHYDARQVGIRGNHVALVDAGRAGPNCAIKDGDGFAICNANPASLAGISTKENIRMSTITIDGLPVNLGDEAAVRAVIAKKDAAIAAAETALADAKAEHDRAIAAKDAQIDDLKAKAIDQAQIDALADAKAAVVADAKKLAGDKLGDTAGKSVADVRRMALSVKLGDAAIEGKSDDYIAARFDAALEGVTEDKATVHNIAPVKVADTASVRDLVRSARY